MSPIVLIILLVCFGALVWLSKIRRERRPKLPPPITNRLEQLLGDQGVSPATDILAALKETRLLVPMAADGTPMLFSGRIPDPAGRGEPVKLGPHIYAFTSAASVQFATSDRTFGRIVRMLLTQTGCSEPVERPSQEIFRAALEKGCLVWVNPFVGLSKALSLEELQQLTIP